MKIIIEAKAKEIADFVLEIQNRPKSTEFERWYLEKRKEAFDEIQSRESSEIEGITINLG